jgi:hypothetical protein
MNAEQVTLMAQKSFVDATQRVLESIEKEWKSQFGFDTRGFTNLQSALNAMKEDSVVLQQDIENLECEEQDLNDHVKEVLFKRAEAQIQARRIQVPRDFFEGHTEMVKTLMDRAVNPHMWVVHYRWRTGPYQDYWGGRTRTQRTYASFLCGRSDGQDWAVRIPGTIQTVAKALDWLVPAVIKKAQREGKTVYRQGDMYFIQQRLWNHDMNALRGSRHVWSGGYSGAGTVSHPQHPEVTLTAVDKKGYAWRAVQQFQMANENERVGAD